MPSRQVEMAGAGELRPPLSFGLRHSFNYRQWLPGPSTQVTAALDKATALPRVYPNWFVYDIADRKATDALTA